MTVAVPAASITIKQHDTEGISYYFEQSTDMLDFEPSH